MPEAQHSDDTHKALFLQLIIMLAGSVMQQLGKIISPLTGKTELNLEAAQATIDLLEMLQAKTKGNLDKEEERMLRSTLATLQMNYVETAQSAPAAAEPPKQEAERSAQGGDAGPPPSAGTGKPPDEEGPRFHKTYD